MGTPFQSYDALKYIYEKLGENIPILSLDYKLAPDQKYPDQLEEITRVLTYLKKFKKKGW
mgnify:CR=1 FL=1